MKEFLTNLVITPSPPIAFKHGSPPHRWSPRWP